nr:hypothetical protein [Mycoplasmopsis canis]
MGFTENDFNKIRPLYEKNILTKDSLYRQAGNSIEVETKNSNFKAIEDIESLGEENGQK